MYFPERLAVSTGARSTVRMLSVEPVSLVLTLILLDNTGDSERFVNEAMEKLAVHPVRLNGSPVL